MVNKGKYWFVLLMAVLMSSSARAQEILVANEVPSNHDIVLFPFFYTAFKVMAENVPCKDIYLEGEGLFIKKDGCRFILNIKDLEKVRTIDVYNEDNNISERYV